jgi:hypothetical protein
MFAKTTKTLIAALVLASTSLALVANASAAPNQGVYTDHYGLGYTNSARVDPRNTNGF